MKKKPVQKGENIGMKGLLLLRMNRTNVKKKNKIQTGFSYKLKYWMMKLLSQLKVK